VIIGKRNTGKSYLARDLVHHHNDIPTGTIIVPYTDSNPLYQEMAPTTLHDKYSTDIVEKVRSRQEDCVKEKNQEEMDPRAYLILDNCFYDDQWSKDPSMQYLMCNKRALKLFLIITMPYAFDIHLTSRTYVDYVMIFRDNYEPNKKRIFNMYGSFFPSVEVFCQVMDQCTKNHECLVIDNTSKSHRWEDNVFWYKASA
jgi:hypothetical protein